MSEIDIVQGELIPQRVLYGGVAINCIVKMYADPTDWEFKQFTSQQDMEQFAADNLLVIRSMQSGESDNGG
jgi:hypothetical protein